MQPAYTDGIHMFIGCTFKCVTKVLAGGAVFVLPNHMPKGEGKTRVKACELPGIPRDRDSKMIDLLTGCGSLSK